MNQTEKEIVWILRKMLSSNKICWADQSFLRVMQVFFIKYEYVNSSPERLEFLLNFLKISILLTNEVLGKEIRNYSLQEPVASSSISTHDLAKIIKLLKQKIKDSGSLEDEIRDIVCEIHEIRFLISEAKNNNTNLKLPIFKLSAKREQISGVMFKIVKDKVSFANFINSMYLFIYEASGAGSSNNRVKQLFSSDSESWELQVLKNLQNLRNYSFHDYDNTRIKGLEVVRNYFSIRKFTGSSADWTYFQKLILLDVRKLFTAILKRLHNC